MKAYVLDTMIVAALMRGDERVVASLKNAGRKKVFLPQPVVAETAYGLARLPKSKKKATLQRDFDAILREVPRASWTDDASRVFGTIKAALRREGNPLEDFDIAIAAHAIAAEAVLVTGNVRHMSRIPDLELEDWTLAPTE